MALGATHHNWRPDVARIVEQLERRFPAVKCNTYENHPWSGWDGRSIDVWDRRGRGYAIDRAVGHRVVEWLRRQPGEPYIRHHIYLRRLWTSFGGYSSWNSNDHSGRLRHVHVTYW